MIEKLQKRIFLLIMVCLSILIIGTILVFSFLNYRNTINTVTLMMDRVVEGDKRKEGNEKLEEKENSKIDLDGLYSVIIENGRIINKSDIVNKELEQYSLKIANNNKNDGIIDKYIYKVRNIKENTKMIIFLENEDTISHINTILLYSGIITVISLIIVSIIAQRLAILIVKPVEETITKQKQFISDASHELKTPLAVIEANTDVLENEVGRNKWIQYIQAEIESMDKLVNDLLLLTKIENNDTIEEYVEINVSKETEIIVSMFESLAYEKQIKLQSNVKENIIFKCNKEDIKHILSTLIDNAIKHTLPEKEVIVELSKEKNEIIFQVKNTGEPIPKEEREKIFERFYRIDKSRNRNEKRYGLGLAIAKSTVQKYNGKIEVNCKNNLTIFKITIPQ